MKFVGYINDTNLNIFSLDGNNYCVSYKSLIAYTQGNELVLGEKWDYSTTTTSKHLNEFLSYIGHPMAKMTKAQKEKYIKDNNIRIEEI